VPVVVAPSRRDARARVFALLAQIGALSRADLARRTGLAASTVSAVVAELQAEGLATERDTPTQDAERPAIGRPPTLVCLHRGAGVALGIDVGKRHVRVALADFSHTVLAERFQALAAEPSATDAIDVVARLVDRVIADADASEEEIAGVGMGVPGAVHHPSGSIGDASLLPGWVGVDMARAMSEALGHTVEIENDANLGALSEWMWGAGRGVDDLVYLKVATGIGAGFVVRGQPYTGATGTAGEIGHTVIDPHGPICRCGSRGCVETIASSPAILSALRESYGPELTLPDAIARALAGDAGCRRAITDAGRAIGSAVAVVCNLFNPALVIVGGDVLPAGELLLEPLRSQVRERAIRSAAQDAQIVPSALGERTDMLGAVALVLRRGAQLLPGAHARA
jgi:predicted NBD/HSP70 family sugar kinase